VGRLSSDIDLESVVGIGYTIDSCDHRLDVELGRQRGEVRCRFGPWDTHAEVFDRGGNDIHGRNFSHLRPNPWDEVGLQTHAGAREVNACG